MADNQDKVHIDEEEFAVAEKAAQKSGYSYTHTFAEPFNYQGKAMTKIEFNFGKLTGRDGLVIENEIQRLGRSVIAPAFSIDYLIRMAARAANPVIGTDAFDLMPLSDFNRIRSAARGFLMRSEL